MMSRNISKVTSSALRFRKFTPLSVGVGNGSNSVSKNVEGEGLCSSSSGSSQMSWIKRYGTCIAKLPDDVTKDDNPVSLLHNPSLALFKSCLHSWGARTLFQNKNDMEDSKINTDTKKHDSFGKDDTIVESDDSDVVEPDNEPPQKDQESLSTLKDGEVIGIHSISEMETKLNAASKTSRLAILYFTATWCGPCRFISPLYVNLAGKYPKIVFLKVDIDEARDVAERWNISSVPTFFFVRNGKEIDMVVGADKNALENKIAQHAGSS
ncbi:TPR repeat-containing thioredoxin TDX-like [Humulus lupulus]|uniref:TPR repeat-containing thioredoxin TDX-like n=1 Tax=Humulus lupulus TaxID=3486 RepID=UPI002B402E1C|nr:TPR repeat-containing thioredoxin TDX-like [Humulus lupulus]